MGTRKRHSDEQLNRIYDRTSGRCHVCRKKLAFCNYGRFGNRGAWEVDHSRPVSRGGTNHGNNLFAICIPCNREKQASGTRSMRARNGFSRAPLSANARKRAKRQNAVAGGLLGAVPGALFGPIGVAVGAAIGAKLGHSYDPDDD